jgi:hypothetical protein
MKNKFETKDFYLTAFLLASGFTLRGHTKNAGLTTFEFEETQKLTNAIGTYYGFASSVEPITYGNSMRTLKSIIHENTNGIEQYHSQSRKSI